ncbi:MAG: hypothetical protein R3B40_03205 [Polyangiales bacterium]
MVRIDPNMLTTEFLTQQNLIDDLDAMAAQVERELADAVSAGRGETYLRRIRDRQSAVGRARQAVLGFREGHVVGEVPSSAISPARSLRAERAARWGMQGLRVAGGVLIVYGAYTSVQRVREAPQRHRARVTSQEIGGWGGGFAGAWAVGKVFAVGGAVLGVETGPGAIVTGGVGAVLGGVIGAIGGALGADWVYTLLNEEDEAETCGIACGAPSSEILMCR